MSFSTHRDDWRQALRQALDSQDRAALARVPKTDLHCHGLLSAPRETYEALLGRPLPPPPQVFGDFDRFSDYITQNLLPALTGRRAVQAIIRGAYEHMVADGVVYAEVSFDLLVPDFVGMAMEEFGEILGEEAERVAGRISIAPEVGISRKMAPDFAAALLAKAIALGVFRAVDLYDDENHGAISDFVPLYRLARDGGLRLKAHAGELCPAERVRESVLLLDLDAVQHGVRAAESPEVVDFLAQRGTVLNVCPTSNCSLGVVGSLESHPARRLFERGVRLTVNSDDFTLFGAAVSDEILNLRRMGFTPGEIEEIVANGLAQMPRP